MRYKRLLVSGQVFVGFCREGLGPVCACVQHGLPADAKFLYAAPALRAGYFELVIESASFDELAEGDEIPELPAPVIRTQHIAATAEEELRQEFWLNHGCPESVLFAGGGEMQCNNQNIHAPADFKHDDLDTLRELVKRTRLHFAALVFTAAQADDSVKH